MYYLTIPEKSIPRFLSAGRFISKQGHIHPRRRLDSAVLLVGYSGVCPMVQDGREYSLEKGCAMLLFPQHEHYGSAKGSENQSHFWCHFYLPEGCELSDREPKDTDGLIVIPEFSKVGSFGRLCVLFPQMIDAAEALRDGDGLCREICSAYLKILLCELSRDRSSLSESGRPSAVVAARALEHIRLHAKQGIVPRDVADSLGYSPDYLSALLRRETGKALGAHITEAKIREAERLLLNSDLKVSEIAYASGFSDEKYFMRCFSALRGITAGEFRRAHYREHKN